MQIWNGHCEFCWVPIGADRDPSIQTHSSPISIRCHLSEWGPDSVLKHNLGFLRTIEAVSPIVARAPGDE
jgi:hypothetical protein